MSSLLQQFRWWDEVRVFKANTAGSLREPGTVQIDPVTRGATATVMNHILVEFTLKVTHSHISLEHEANTARLF